ncbi:MAG: DNA polymerase III subunit gamma/tau [Bacteroidota bacterium]
MENFVVSARKYRPDTFRSVVGQKAITSTLQNAIRNGHLGHAYLFSGPRGVGKTTCARIFAKTINCFNLSDKAEACNECESCRSFSENRSYNIHELDAASNNSVDDIRTLTDQVRIPPQVGKYSIYIIDEVHMLSQAAFNAFLKTLEEPPAHAIFILATTEKHKILPTILSRCQIFDFNRIKIEDTVEYLQYIAGKENITAEAEGLHIIAQKADGAMRDALSIFDQVVSFSGNTISYQGVIENLNILDYEYYFKLTDTLIKGDIGTALLLFNEILEKGFDARNFINGYAAHLRDLMVCRNPETVVLLEVGASIRERYLEQSKRVDLNFLYEGLNVCSEADMRFRSSRNQRLTIELALLQLANLEEVQKKKSDSAQVNPLPSPAPVALPVQEANRGPAPASANTANQGSGRSQSRSSEEEKTVAIPSISIRNSLKTVPKEDPAPAVEVPAPEEKISAVKPSAELDLLSLQEAWKEYAENNKEQNPRIYTTLINHLPRISEDELIRVSLDSAMQSENFARNIKPGLLGFLRKKFGVEALNIETTVAETADNKKMLYTDHEKLDHLISRNPELGKLKSAFQLDFDE